MSMSIIFDSFPNRRSADRFVKKVKEDYGLRSVVYNDMKEVEAAEEKDFYGVWHPFECKPHIVHTDRACDCDKCWKKIRDKSAIRTLAKELSDEDYAIKAAAAARPEYDWYKPEKTDFLKDCIECVIEEAVARLAKTFGGKWVGT
jgi:hypothetical protein